jgi:hypothetical protein
LFPEIIVDSQNVGRGEPNHIRRLKVKEIAIAMYSVRYAGKRRPEGGGPSFSGLVTYLPPMWVRDVGLKPKDEVIVTRVAGESCIRIYPPGKYKLGGRK